MPEPTDTDNLPREEDGEQDVSQDPNDDYSLEIPPEEDD